MQYEDRQIHEQMSDQSTDNHTVRFQQEVFVEAIPANHTGIQGHEEQEGQIPAQTTYGIRKIFPGEVEVEKTSCGQRDEIQDQSIIVGILVNETDIQQNQHNVKGAEQPDGSFLFRADMSQPDEHGIQPVGGKYRGQNEDQKKNVLIFLPVISHCRYFLVDDVVK